MREILFKAKRKNWKELPKEQWWVEGYYFCMAHTDGRHTHHFIIPIGVSLEKGTPIEKIQVEIDVNTLCQYTGFNDKNGKKIWENDIVKFDVYEYEKLVSSTVSEIKWCEELCALSVAVNKQGTRGTLGHFLDLNKEVEIIGNIFDNPDLLRKEE